MNKKTCVIGGSGFIGFSLLPFLKINNRDVTVVGRKEFSAYKLPQDIKYLFGDIKNERFAHNFLNNTDEIIYLAHSSTPTSSFKNLFDELHCNLISAVTFFDIASKYNIKKIIYVSSGGAVYGECKGLPISEIHPTNPISPYGISKLAIEKYAQLFYKIKKLPVVCIRPSNIYGEHQKPFIGQGFISTAIASILADKEINIYGRNGTIRDYIYIDDFVRGLILALEKGLPGEIYNLGSGIGTSNIEIITKLRRNPNLKNKRFNLIYQPPRESDVSCNILDASKFNQLCNWKPSIKIDEGVERVVNFYLNSSI